jgi:hypothetical protein
VRPAVGVGGTTKKVAQAAEVASEEPTSRRWLCLSGSSEEAEVGSEEKEDEEESGAARFLGGCSRDLVPEGRVRACGAPTARSRGSSTDQAVLQPATSFKDISVIRATVPLAVDVHSAEPNSVGKFSLAFPLDVAITSRARVLTLDYRRGIPFVAPANTSKLRDGLRSTGIGLLICVERQRAYILQQYGPLTLGEQGTVCTATKQEHKEKLR